MHLRSLHVVAFALFALGATLAPRLAVAQKAAAAAAPRLASQDKRVIVFVGMPGAGKSTAAGRLADTLGAPRWTSGNVIRNTIQARGLPYTAENDRKVAEEFARTPGEIGQSAKENEPHPPVTDMCRGCAGAAPRSIAKKCFSGLIAIAKSSAADSSSAGRTDRIAARRSTISPPPRHGYSWPVAVTRTRLQPSQKLPVSGVMKPILLPVWVTSK